MGFEIFGYRFFDLSSKVTYGDAFLTITIVCAISLLFFYIAKNNAPK